MGRLKKTEGAEAIRLRWYGAMETDQIFVERKTHREDWTGEKSVKARFSLKEKNVNGFLSGKMTVEEVFAKMKREGKKSEKEINDLEQLAREIQYRVITRKLVPVTRSFYNRTAFQLPGDARVRISLDTELTMTREDNLDGRERAGKNWRRMDIGIDFPFSQLKPEDVERFPYAVLEVKLQTQAGQEPPEWVRELISSHLVEAVPKFSKFIHGTTTLFPTRIHLLPYWMPQMDVDIRKPITHHFGIKRPDQSTTYSTTTDNALDDDSEDEEDDLDKSSASSCSRTLHGDEDADSDEGIRRLRAARDAMEQHDMDRDTDFPQHTSNDLDIEERIAASPLTHPDDYPLYDSEDEDDHRASSHLEEARHNGALPYAHALLAHHAVAAGHWLSGSFQALFPDPTRAPLLDSTPEAKRFKAPPGKRIHVPVRVEPKVFFATERTFLAWLEVAILLGSIAGALLNFGDDVSMTAAWGFTLVACAALLYSVGLYLWRVRMIRGRRSVRYHDWLGPSVLCGGLLVAVGLNFGLRVGRNGWVV